MMLTAVAEPFGEVSTFPFMGTEGSKRFQRQISYGWAMFFCHYPSILLYSALGDVKEEDVHIPSLIVMNI